MKKIFVFTLLLLFAVQIGSAFAVKAELEVTPKILKLGESGRCTIRIYDVDSPLMPKIYSKDFDFVSAGTGSQVRIINGKYEKFQSFTYYFTPRKIGEFTIGPFDYEYKRGKTVKLNAVKIKVVAPEQSGKKTAKIEDYLFGKISSSSESVYKGQTVDIILSIYYKDLNVGNRFRLLELNAHGLELGDFADLGEKREVIGNDVYSVRQFKVPATVTEDDNVSIAPVLGVPIITRSRTNNFFNDPFFDGFNTQTNYVNIKFDKLNLNVKPIPINGRPKSYNGAVGKFQFNAQISPTEVNVGEPIKIDFTIKGEGNISFVVPPEIDFGDKFKAYEMSLINENISKDGRSGRKLYEQVIVPKSADVKEVPEISFSYFDPFEEKFKEIKYGPFPITVKGGKNNQAVVVKSSAKNAGQVTNEKEKEIVRDEILYLKPAPSEISNEGFWKLDSNKILIGYLPPFAALFLIILYFSYFGKNNGTDFKKVLKRTLKEIAEFENKNFNDLSKEDYAKLNRTVQDYFRGVFGLKEGETPYEDLYLNDKQKKFFTEFFGLMEKISFSYEKSKPNKEELKTMLANLKANLKEHNALASKKGIGKELVVSVILFSLFVCTSFNANAIDVADVQQKFVTASKYYDSGKFDEAIKIYESVADEGVKNEALFYNLGNAYFKSGKFGAAILNYKRALFINPQDSDARVNLKFAKEKLKLNDNNKIYNFIESFKFKCWFYFSVILSWTFVLLLFIFIKFGFKPVRFVLIANVILFLFSAFGVYHWNDVRKDNNAVVIGKNPIVRYAPIRDSKEYFKLKEGETVEISDLKNNWFKILYDNKKGWIQSDKIERIWE